MKTLPLLPVLVYNAFVRLQFAFLLFSYGEFSPLVKALFLPVLDGFDISHMIRWWMCVNHIPDTYQNFKDNLIADKLVDFTMYMIYYKVVFEKIATQQMKRIICIFFMIRLVGVIIMCGIPDRWVPVLFPDFLNAGFIILTFILIYRIDHKFIIPFIIAGCLIKYAVEVFLCTYSNFPKNCVKKKISR